jgi:hypothetical protein
LISEAEIQHHFIDRFLESHGEAPDKFAAALYKRLPKSATVASLETASERLIRSKQSKSFPSFPESLRAIIDASGTGTASAVPGSMAKLVTPENYTAMALDHMKLHAAYGQMGCMIEPGSPEWGLWVAYFIAKQIKMPRMEHIEAFARRPAIEGVIQWVISDRYMVPARYPMEFDASAPAEPITWAEHRYRERQKAYFAKSAASHNCVGDKQGKAA